MAKRKTATVRSAKKAVKKKAAKPGPVRGALEQALNVGRTVLKNAAARRARRQAAVVNALAGGTTFAKKMNARAARKTATAKSQSRGK